MRRRAITAGCLAAAALGAAATWTVSNASRLPDWMTAEARSPDGTLVARSWCTDGCDVAESRTITISDVAERAALERRAEHSEGDMPEEAAAVRVFYHGDGDPSLIWTGSRSLRVEAACLSDGNYRPLRPLRFAGVDVSFVRAAAPVDCPSEVR